MKFPTPTPDGQGRTHCGVANFPGIVGVCRLSPGSILDGRIVLDIAFHPADLLCGERALSPDPFAPRHRPQPLRPLWNLEIRDPMFTATSPTA